MPLATGLVGSTLGVAICMYQRALRKVPLFKSKPPIAAAAAPASRQFLRKQLRKRSLSEQDTAVLRLVRAAFG